MTSKAGNWTEGRISKRKSGRGGKWGMLGFIKKDEKKAIIRSFQGG